MLLFSSRLSLLLFSPSSTASPPSSPATPSIPPIPLDLFSLAETRLLAGRAGPAPNHVRRPPRLSRCDRLSSMTSVSLTLRRLPRPNRPKKPSTSSFAQQHKHISKRMMMAAMTPITIPAIAPPLSPWLVVCAPLTTPMVAAGVSYGTVDAGGAVEVRSAVDTLVTRAGAVTELVT